MRKVWPAREYRDHGRFILTDYDNGGGFEPFEISEADWREYAPLERFCLLRGKAMAGTAYPYRKMRDKLCFQNAATELDRRGGTYAEGIAYRPGLPIYVHHAWVVRDGVVVDPTWRDPEECLYLGVEFDKSELWARLVETGHYGLFASHAFYYVDWMQAQEPRLAGHLKPRGFQSSLVRR